MDAPRFEPADAAYEQRVRASFGRQAAMATIGATLAEVEPGRVVIELPWQQALTQQHGFLHAGMVATALDSACGYAGFSLMQPDAAVLTIEFKINLLAPAQGQRFRMEGLVIKPGRTITVTEGRAYALDGGREKLVATMGATLMAVAGRGIQH
ncbi:PaaI family thioesterase [Ramlibacter sp. XY19]|uniref:PaaI family thioesterase n=1 Tax=Ramlibacter paludis TaxID=2908000 RepID=UPI0023DB2EDC|nr:PaaI family thioesterase [Ramlibacter paludis]MCG2591597.1 PaaI family thioesterase [Ramlibacter paludis]